MEKEKGFDLRIVESVVVQWVLRHRMYTSSAHVHRIRRVLVRREGFRVHFVQTDPQMGSSFSPHIWMVVVSRLAVMLGIPDYRENIGMRHYLS